jgi:hypothetical protein
MEKHFVSRTATVVSSLRDGILNLDAVFGVMRMSPKQAAEAAWNEKNSCGQTLWSTLEIRGLRGSSPSIRPLFFAQGDAAGEAKDGAGLGLVWYTIGGIFLFLGEGVANESTSKLMN